MQPVLWSQEVHKASGVISDLKGIPEILVLMAFRVIRDLLDLKEIKGPLAPRVIQDLWDLLGQKVIVEKKENADLSVNRDLSECRVPRVTLGPQGIQGDKGCPGPQGEQGIPGPQGEQGIQGSQVKRRQLQL